MLVQLQELAILDEKSGKQVVSVKGKTRQTFKQKPVTAKIEAGQEVIESHDYLVSLSGIISKTSKDRLSKLAESESKVAVSGYAKNGMVLEGHGHIKKDGNAFVIESNGIGGYNEYGVLKSGMSFSERVGSLRSKSIDAMPIYFPFQKEMQLSFRCSNAGSVIIEYFDHDKNIIDMHVEQVSYIPRHIGWVNKSISIMPVDGCVFISVSSIDNEIENLLIKLK